MPASQRQLAILGAAALAFALAAALHCAPDAAAGEIAVEPPVPTILPANDQERKAALDAITVAETENNPEKLAAALAQLHERKHADFVAVVKAHVEDADPKVQAAAITAAAAQEMKDVEKLVRKTLRTKPKKSAMNPGVVMVACTDYLARMSVAGEEETVLKDHLQPILAEPAKIKLSWAREMCRSAIHYFGRTKYKPAVPYLIETLLPAPVPKDPNDPNNPPKEYWEARTKLWNDYEGWTRWALKEITGKEFRSAREWQAWLKQQDKKEFK